MKAGYEEKFMKIQGEMVSLCLETVEGLEVSKIYLYESMAQHSRAFNAFCEIDGVPKYLNEAGVEIKRIRRLLDIGTDDLMKELRDLCKEYEVPRPTEIKATYDVETGGFEVECEYDTIDVDTPEAMKVWIDALKAAKAAGTQA